MIEILKETTIYFARKIFHMKRFTALENKLKFFTLSTFFRTLYIVHAVYGSGGGGRWGVLAIDFVSSVAVF